MTSLEKCNFCDKEATCFGSYMCYAACDGHAKDGEAVEAKMWDAMEQSPEVSDADK